MTIENLMFSYRDFRRFLMQPDTVVTIVDNEERGPIPIVKDSKLYWASIDRAQIAFRLLPPTQEAQEAAEGMRSAWYVLAASRAHHPAGRIPNADLGQMRDAESAFLTISRRAMLGQD